MDLDSEIMVYGIVHQVPIMMSDGMEFLLEMVRKKDASSFLEVGTAIGRTAIAVAGLKDNMQVVTLERDPDMIEQAKANIEKSGMQDRIRLIEGDAREADLEGQTFDIIFIDAAKSQYTRFFEKFKDNLAEDGWIITDNMFFHGLVEHPERTQNRHTKGLIRRLKAYHDFLESNDEFETQIIEIGDGIAISRRKTHA